MNLLKFFRKPSFIFMSAIGFFIFSCTQYDLNSNRSFDFAAYNKYKSGNYKIDFSSLLGLTDITTTLEEKRAILDLINIELGANLELPDEALLLFDKTIDEVINSGLELGTLKQADLNLAYAFDADINESDFETAFTNFQDTVLEMELSDEEFSKYNAAANIMLSAEDDLQQFERSFINNTKRGGNCWWEMAVFLLNLLAFFAACVTIVLCILAGVLMFESLYSYDKCVQE